MTGVVPPLHIRKRLNNLFLPGHSEILTYAFHHSGLCSKHKIRAAFDHDVLRRKSSDSFSKLIDNLNTFKELKFNPLLWTKICKGFVYSLLQQKHINKIQFDYDRESL
jgi:hypothetical protein